MLIHQSTIMVKLKYGKVRRKHRHSVVCKIKSMETLEYQLAFENEKCRLLLTPSLQNKDELVDLMTMIEENKPLDDMLVKLRESDENNRVIDSITKSNEDSWNDEMKKKAIFASRYLNSVGKGENALELSSELRENLMDV